uniref:BTB domain-containing protein n=1 Tax=Panagrolaimus sp. ES5 TaxID=591445 RepID=A0AC34F8R7_9BILA
MLLKTPLLKACIISFTEKTTINFDENIEFSLTPQLSGNGTYIFHVQDVKGDFEITKIRNQRSGADIPYDDVNKTFVTGNGYANYNFEFHVTTDIEFKKVGYVNVSHQLQVSAARMKLLKVYECYEENFALVGHEYMKFKYLIKKIRDNCVEIVVENPLEVEIQGKACDFKHEAADSADINLALSFVFDPDVLKRSHQHLKIPDPAQALYDLTFDDNESEQIKNKRPTLYEILSDSKYTDVILISSEGKKIPSHRCVLAKYSEIFTTIFAESKDNPTKINVDGFDANVIVAALDFCYGKDDAIVGNESKLFDFANKYSMPSLKEACCSYFEDKVNTKNVCEIIQIAYSNNFDGLKQKCKKILTGHKEEVNASKLKELPKDILFDVYCV